MTKAELWDYQSKKEEIKELKYKIRHMADGDAMVGNDVIMDYRTGYPRPQSVVGTDQERMRNLKARYTSRISKLETECTKVENFIEDIPDSMTRRIFRMYFFDCMSQQKISRKVHISQSEVSKIISEYLKME